MTRLTHMIIGTNEPELIHVEATPSSPHAFWITFGEHHRPLLSSSESFETATAALEAGWKIVGECRAEYVLAEKEEKTQ